MKYVTVVVPVYGVEQYIVAAVKSVLAQTYTHFELLIVDDGSPDRSIELCRQFTDPRIKILQQPNGGPAAARNLGIYHAKGDYIAFLDGDDIWLPDKLAKHVAHLESSPEVGVSFCRSALINEAGTPLGIYQVVTKLDRIRPIDLLCRTPISNGSVPVIRREALEAIRYTVCKDGQEHVCYFNPDRQLHPSEDVECWLRIAIKTPWTIAGIPEALTLYRVNSQGFSANLWKKLLSWEQMLSEAQQYGAEPMKRCKAPAMAYQLRHLARRAVSLRDGAIAMSLIHAALTMYPYILIEEPYRTLQTLFAAYLVRLLPQTFYQQCEAAAMQLAGGKQQQQISKEQISKETVEELAVSVFSAGQEG
jgi:glycosyltransferase involved in cell wall biosynthesis